MCGGCTFHRRMLSTFKWLKSVPARIELDRSSVASLNRMLTPGPGGAVTVSD